MCIRDRSISEILATGRVSALEGDADRFCALVGARGEAGQGSRCAGGVFGVGLA